MLKTLFRNWWVWILRGVLAILLGVLALTSPGTVAATLLMWLAIFLIIDGMLGLISVFSTWKQQEDKWLLVLEGGLSLILGMLVLLNLGATIVFAIMYLGVWTIFSGAMRIVMAIQLRKEIEGEGWLIAGGALNILFGLIIIAQPGIGISTLMTILGIFALLLGGLLIALGFKIRKAGKHIKGKVGDWRENIETARANR